MTKLAPFGVVTEGEYYAYFVRGCGHKCEDLLRVARHIEELVSAPRPYAFHPPDDQHTAQKIGVLVISELRAIARSPKELRIALDMTVYTLSLVYGKQTIERVLERATQERLIEKSWCSGGMGGNDE